MLRYVQVRKQEEIPDYIGIDHVFGLIVISVSVQLIIGTILIMLERVYDCLQTKTEIN